MKSLEYKNWMLTAMQAALDASVKILEVYKSSFSVEKKEDKSPLTLADKQSHKIIYNALSSLGIPIISEEGYIPEYPERKQFEKFWLVDPLDGTKEFVNKNGQFAINIGLIEKDIPVLGLIYIPVENKMYFAAKNEGAFKINLKPGLKVDENIFDLADVLPNQKTPEKLTIVASRSHKDTKLAQVLELYEAQFKEMEVLSVGSSIKWCMMAEGVAHKYLRYSPTMEWDTASGQIIAEEAGCQVFYDGKLPFTYNKEILRNKGFEVIRNE